MTKAIDLSSYFQKLERIAPTVCTGVVTELIGLLVESAGPAAAIGDFCEIRTLAGRNIRTQVIGFRNGRVLSMPLEEMWPYLPENEVAENMIARKGRG